MSVLPAGWTDVNLGDIGVEAQSGFPSGKHNSDGVGIPHLRPMNVDRLGRIDLSEVKYVEPDRDLRLAAGDVLFNNTNSPALIGKTAYFDRIGDYAFSNHMTRLRVPEGIEPKYLAIQLHTMWMRGVFQRLCSHHVNQASVSATRLLAEVSLTIPPLNEQRRIVAAIEEHLSRLDAADASLAAGLLRVEALRRRSLHALTTADGKRCVVGDVAEVQGGIQKQPKRRPIKNRYPFLRVANVLRGELDLADVHEIELFDGELDRLALRAGDLLVVEGNGSATQIGRSAMWRAEIDPCVHQNHLIRVRPGDSLDPRYLDLYWNAPETAARIASVASSTSGLYTLSAAKVRAVEVVVPPLERQRRIVAEIEERLGAIDALRAAIERAQRRGAALRRSVLERAFRGELVPQDPSDEPASVLLDRIRAERSAAPARRRPGRVRR